VITVARRGPTSLISAKKIRNAAAEEQRRSDPRPEKDPS
jgi:hypothetical protein